MNTTQTDPRPDLSMVFAIHGALTRDAQLLIEAISRLEPQDRIHQIPAIAEYFAAFASQLQNHHRHEDEVFFPALVAKVGSDAMGLDTLDAQHHALEPAIARTAAALRTVGDVRTGFAAAKACAIDSIETLNALLHEHLALEETVALPLYADVLSVDEHLALEQRVQEMGTLEDLAFMIPWLFDAIPPAVRDQIMAGLPGFLRNVYVDHRQAYRALAGCLYATH